MPKELLDLLVYWQGQFGRLFLITWCIVFGVKEKLELSRSVNSLF